MDSAKDLNTRYAETNKRLADFFHVNPDHTKWSDEQVEEVKVWNAEMNDLGVKRDKVREIEAIQEKTREIGKELDKPQGRPFSGNGNGHATGTEIVPMKSFGDTVVATLYKNGELTGNKQEIEVKDYGFAEFKTTLMTTTGFPPAVTRGPRLEFSLQKPITVTDVLPTIPITAGNSYVYMRETTFTNATTAIAEGGTYPESALAYTQITLTPSKIGTFIPVTEEQLSDVDGMRALIDSRLQLMVRLEVERQILQTDGSANTINGFYNQVTQTQAGGTDPVFDAVLKGMMKVRNTGLATPDAVILHPDQYTYIRLARTEDGLYIMGNPDQVGVDRLFGVRTIVSQSATSGTALVGDFSTHCALITRWGMDVQASNSHDLNFIKDIWVVKARMRLGLAIFRPEAFCEVTGLLS